MGPELNPKEERELANLIELQIDTAREEAHTHEVLKCMACEAGNLSEDGYCDACNAKTDI